LKRRKDGGQKVEGRKEGRKYDGEDRGGEKKVGGR
jgi:hypothetical protein